MTISDNEKLNSNILGFVDYYDYQRVSGWLADFSDIEKLLSIKVLIDGTEVCRGVADQYRQDLASHPKFNGTFHAYNLEIPSKYIDGKKHEVQVMEIETGYLLKKTHKEKITHDKSSSAVKPYQSFDGINGDSCSSEKLRRLRLPSLAGKSVLDIGCNEGFFCNFSVTQGAKRVLGIDSNSKIIEQAKKRTPTAEFTNTDWWNLPNEKFDLIFFLSAIHYEKNQKKLLSHLRSHLTDNGILVLECGVSQYNLNHWYTFQRHDGALRYPNFNYLIDALLSDYAVTTMGRSVDQPGDPVPRFVFHCTPRNSTALLIYGSSGIGKTVLARSLMNQNVYTYSIDNLFHRIIENLHSPKNKVCDFIKSHGDIMKLDTLSETVIEAGLSSELVKSVINEIPIESKMFIIEGEMLIHEEFRRELTSYLKQNGVVVWNVTKQ